MDKSQGKKKTGKIRWFLLLIAVLVAMYMLFWGYATMINTVRSVAQSQMEEVANRAIHTAIRDASVESGDWEELVKVNRGPDGSIESLTLNSPAANRLKSDISHRIMEYLEDSDKYTIGVPLGNFLSSEFFWGFGPRIKFKIIPCNIARINFESKFTQAGINQVLHSVSVKAEVNIAALLPGFEEISTVSSDAMVSETVIIGNVPETYLSIDEE